MILIKSLEWIYSLIFSSSFFFFKFFSFFSDFGLLLLINLSLPIQTKKNLSLSLPLSNFSYQKKKKKLNKFFFSNKFSDNREPQISDLTPISLQAQREFLLFTSSSTREREREKALWYFFTSLHEFCRTCFQHLASTMQSRIIRSIIILTTTKNMQHRLVRSASLSFFSPPNFIRFMITWFCSVICIACLCFDYVYLLSLETFERKEVDSDLWLLR